MAPAIHTPLVHLVNEHTDALTYPLLFPYGEKGWCPELVVARTRERQGNVEQLRPGDKLTMCGFYAQRIMLFDDNISTKPQWMNVS